MMNFLIGFVILGSFAAWMFKLGNDFGVKSTESRWSEAIAKKETSERADCERANPRDDSWKRFALLLVAELKLSPHDMGCHPSEGVHTERCQRVRNLLKQIDPRESVGLSVANQETQDILDKARAQHAANVAAWSERRMGRTDG